jgi:hypothetical protein
MLKIIFLFYNIDLFIKLVFVIRTEQKFGWTAMSTFLD